MKNFWTKLPKPFFALAPMEDVTDAAFRRLIARYGKPDVMFTEFTSADGLFFANPVRSRARASAPEGPLGRAHRVGMCTCRRAISNGAGRSGWEKLQKKLLFSDEERPIVAQLFTASPERMKKAAEMVAKLGFDGIDINMGCPDRAVEKSGCGAALMKNPKLACELIRAAGETGLPVSVKTRTGYLIDELETWLPELLAENLSAVTIHARTRKEMSDVPARWETIAQAVEIRDSLKSKTLIIGNGDVRDLAEAREKAEMSGCDGVMLGRAIFGNPFLFQHSQECWNVREAKLKALAEHLKLFQELLAETSSYATMKKHFATYVKGWSGAKELRMKLMETNNVTEALSVFGSLTAKELRQ
ncbi:MAG: tRNA-dihydrouridine synthase [bacterium]|nr:tRNA-dihydrouridine synthase [bacterium]